MVENADQRCYKRVELWNAWQKELKYGKVNLLMYSLGLLVVFV